MANKVYTPMTLAGLSKNLRSSKTEDLRWTDVMEFLEEYRHESAEGLVAVTPVGGAVLNEGDLVVVGSAGSQTIDATRKT